MKLTLIRNKSSVTCTIGKLYINDVFYCYTCEDLDRGLLQSQSVEDILKKKVKAETAIPKGTYTVIINMSNRFKRELPLLLDVKGYEGIRIHPGNTGVDTEGCILPGLSKGAESVGDSRKAFDPLFDKIKEAITKGEVVTITIC